MESVYQHCGKKKIGIVRLFGKKFKNISSGSHVLYTKKCTKMKNARAGRAGRAGRAEPLFLFIKFCGILVAVVVVLS